MGVNHSVQGTETVTLLNTLAAAHRQHRPARARRRSRSPGSATRWAPGRPASRRRCPATAATTTPAHRAELAALWGVDEDRLPAERGRAYPDIINAVVSGRIKGLWIIGTNPVVSYPNREVLEFALRVARPARRPGRLRDADDRARRRRAARRDLGREGRHVHEQRAPGVAGPRGGRPARRGPHRLRHLPRRRRALGLRRRAVRRAGARRATRSRSGGGCRPDGRATTAASPGTRIDAAGGVQWPCPADDPDVAARRARRACTPTCASTAPTAGRACAPSSRVPIRDAPRPELPAAAQHRPHGRALAHAHEDRPHRRSSRGSPRRRGSRCTPTTPRRSACSPGDWVRVAVPARRDRADPRPGHGDRARRRGVRPVPLGRPLRQPAHRRRVRPDQPRAELQAVRGARQQGVALTSVLVSARCDFERATS